MPKVYYVSSAFGNDQNSGLSADKPFASVTAVETLKLAAGDQVLFARGTSYNDELTIKYSGSVGNPITFGAYGEGDPPLLFGHERGIYGSKTSNIVIQDIAISNTAGNAIYAGNAANWVIDNVSVFETGTLRAGSISIQSSTNITIKNSSIQDINGDGIWMDNVTGVLIEKNNIGTVHGGASDNVQVVNSKDVVVRGNTLDMTGSTDSGKGNLVVNKSQNVLIESNELIGGGFGASVNSNDVVIIGNEIHGQSGYTWSFAIGLGEKWSVSNYLISENYIHDVKFGVAITGIGNLPVVRTDIDVVDNVFDNVSGAALKVDRPASGEFSGNAIDIDTKATSVSDTVNKLGTWKIGENTTFNSIDPTAVADTTSIDSIGIASTGNILVNDSSLINAKLNVLQVDGHDVTDTTRVEGTYGHLVVEDDGSFRYNVDAAKMKGVNNDVVDTFSYIVTDNTNNALSSLSINVAARPNNAPQLLADLVAANKSGAASGNVLNNDTDANGDALNLVSVNGINLAGQPLKIAGNYGTLSIASDGTYSYLANTAKFGMLRAEATEVFTYSASDGRAISQSTLSFALSQVQAPVPTTNVKPTAVNDRFAVDAEGRAAGNILANDFDVNGQALFLRTIGGQNLKGGEPTLIGKYGIMHVSANGDFVYEADQHKLGLASGFLSESFQYKISDGSLQDTGSVGIVIDTHLLASYDLVA